MLLNDRKLKNLEKARLQTKYLVSNNMSLFKPLDSSSNELKRQILKEYVYFFFIFSDLFINIIFRTEIINNTKNVLEGVLNDIKDNFKI